MDHPVIGAELNHIDNPVGIALEGQRDLNDAGAQPMQGLRKIGLAALGRNRKRREANRLCPFRELLEFPEYWLEPGSRPGLTDFSHPVWGPSISIMLS